MAVTQVVALWNRTPLPGTDWRLSFTYVNADPAAPPAALSTTLLLGCTGVGAYPPGILTYVGLDTTTPSMAALVANLDGLRLDLDNLNSPVAGRHVAYDLPGGARITPASDPDFFFTPPTPYDVAVEKVGGRLTVKWRPQGGAWEDYVVGVPPHAGFRWGLFVPPGRDARISGISVASYLGDTSRLLPFDPTPSYGDQPDAPPPAPVEIRTVSTVAQLLSAHDAIAPGGHIVVADGVTLDTDFDLARAMPVGTRTVLRANSPQGATLDCDIRIFGDGWELHDFKQAPRSGAAARIRVIDADHVRVSRIDCSLQVGALAVITVEGDRPCDDIMIDRCTVQGYTTWAVALLATADKDVVLAWNDISGSRSTAAGGGVLVGADSQANGLRLLKVAAYNRIADLRGPYGFLVRASRGVYYRNTLARTASGANDLVADNGSENFYVANELSGGSRLLLRGLVPVVLGNRSRGVGGANPACVLYGGTYDPVADGFEPGFPTPIQLQRLTAIAGIQPREAVSGALLASNDLEGTILVGANSTADAVRPIPARNTSVFDHTGDGLASAGATWDAGTQYRPAAARPAGITAPSTFPLDAGDAGVRQDDDILTTSGGGGGGGPAGPNRSGLPWMSGMNGDSSLADMMIDLNIWEAARGRLCDVSTQFFGRQHTSWTQLTDNFLLKANGLVPKLVAAGITPVLTIAHFSSVMPGLSVAAAANGDYDSYHLAAAQKIALLGVPVIIRLGHECDDELNVYSYYYSGVTPDDYVAMFRRHALIYLSTIGSANCRIDWNHLRQGGQAAGRDDDPDLFYPGDDVVQIVSADCYGDSPRGDPSAYVVSDADWLAYLNGTSLNGHPQGPGTWLAYATGHGKQFACPEWGVTNWMGPRTVADSPRYVQGMYEFFSGNAADIAYENYSNRIIGTATGAGGHKLLPSVDNPAASAQYMSEWTQTIGASNYTFGADWAQNYVIKRGDANQSLIAQPAADTVVLTAGSDNTKQAALFFLCKQRPATVDGVWSFYYRRLDANVHTDVAGIGVHFIPSYVGSGGTIPANPGSWSVSIYKPASGEPCGDSILALNGDGLRIGFDEVNEPLPAKSNTLDTVAYQRSLARPSLALAPGQVNHAFLTPGAEWLVTVTLSGQSLTFAATAVGRPAVSVRFDDALIAVKAGGWFGFRLDRGCSCQLRALTYLPR